MIGLLVRLDMISISLVDKDSTRKGLLGFPLWVLPWPLAQFIVSLIFCALYLYNCLKT